MTINLIKKYGVLLLIIFCCGQVRAAEQAAAAPVQAGPVHPGPRPIPEAGEAQEEYGKRIAAWEKLMKAYEATQWMQEEEKKEAAVRAGGNAGWTADTPDEALAAWLAKQRRALRQRAPDVESAIGQKAVTTIGKMIFPEIEQESIVLPGGGASILVISPTGRYIAGLALGERLKIWDTNNLNAQPLVLHDVINAAFLADDRLAVLDENRGKIRALDIVEGRLNAVWDINLKKYRSLKNLNVTKGLLFASPDGRNVALRNVQDVHKEAPYVLVWDVQNLKKRPKKFETGSSMGIFSPDSRYLVVSHSGRLRLWPRAGSGKFFKKFIELKGNVGADPHSVFSSNGQYLLAYGNKGIALWDMHDLQKEPRIKKFNDQVFSAYFLPDSDDIVVVRDEDYTLISEVYDIRNIHAGPLRLAAEYGLASPDNRYQLFFSPGVSGLYIHDMQYPVIYKGLNIPVSDAAFLPHGKYLVTASEGAVSAVRLWNWGLLTREMAKKREQIEAEDKKRWPGERWFRWTKRIMYGEPDSDDEGDSHEGEWSISV